MIKSVSEKNEGVGKYLRWVGITAVGILTLSVGMCSVEQVNAGNRGVFVRNGKPISQTDEGLKIMNPLTTELIEISVRQQKRTATIEAYTKDVQQATIKYTATYHLMPEKVLFTYRTVGEDWDSKLVPQVLEESIKSVFGRSEAVKDTINRRADVQRQIYATATKSLASRNIILDGLELRDISFSSSFEKAVEAKQVAIEKAQKAKNDTVRIREEAEQQIIKANAEAEAMRIKTEALAGSPKLVEYEAVMKWNGKLPQYMMGDSIPFIQIPR